jgi:hypothetical protein
MNRPSTKINASTKQRLSGTPLNTSPMSAFEQEIINNSLLDIKEGRIHSHAAVMKEAAEWLREK